MRKPDTVPVGEALPTQDAAPNLGDGLVTIEAATVEEAMARLAAEVGEEARIVSAEKIPRGGLGGFFAKEVVVLTAQAPEHDRSQLPGVLERMTESAELQEQSFGDVLRREIADRETSAGLGSLLDAAGWSGPPVEGAPDDLLEDPVVADAMPLSDADRSMPAPVTVGPMVSSPAPSRPATPMGAASIVERMTHEHLVAMPPPAEVAAITIPGLGEAMEALETSTAAGGVAIADTAATVVVQAETAAPLAEASVSTAADPVVVEPDLDTPAGLGQPSWNVTELVRHGIPGVIVDAVRGLDPRDDLAWINAVARAVAPWCATLPTGDRLVVGTGADRLAPHLELPLVHLGDVAPYEGSFCSVLAGAEDDRAWLDFVLGGRYLHFVLGEDELWRDLLVSDPAVVSWVSPAGLIDALYLASTLGATLGFGSLGPDEPILRAQPVDIAIGLRRIVGRT